MSSCHLLRTSSVRRILTLEFVPLAGIFCSAILLIPSAPANDMSDVKHSTCSERTNQVWSSLPGDTSALQHGEVTCNVQVSFEGQLLPMEYFRTTLADKEAFLHLKNKATYLVRQKFHMDAPNLHLRSGRCRPHNSKQNFNPLCNQSQWCEIVDRLDSSSTTEFSKGRPRIDVNLDFYTIQIKSVKEQPYVEFLGNELRRQMKTNFENRDYIVIRESIGQEAVAKLVLEDTSFRGNETFSIDNFALDVSHSASKLLVLCVLTGLPLLFLKELRDNDLSDAHLPLHLEQCPSNSILVDFKILLTEQWVILPYEFPQRRALHQLEPDCIVPISFDPRSDKVGIGSYSHVYRVSVDQACHSFPSVRPA